jgi:hypothetical protein
MKPKSAIQKGKALEDYICEQLIEKGLDLKAYRSKGSGSGTGEKADIWTSLTVLGRNAGIEAKNHKVPHIKDWWKQTQKLEVSGREPILVYKLAGEGYKETKAVVYLNSLLELIKLANQVDPQEDREPQENYKLKWLLKSGIDILKKIVKELEKLT